MSKYQFYFINNESTEVEGEGLTYSNEMFIEVVDADSKVLLMVPRERLNYLKQIPA